MNEYKEFIVNVITSVAFVQIACNQKTHSFSLYKWTPLDGSHWYAVIFRIKIHLSCRMFDGIIQVFSEMLIRHYIDLHLVRITCKRGCIFVELHFSLFKYAAVQFVEF